MKSIAFFNNKGGVGKTTLLYHLAWMYARLGLRVVAVDLDPQSNLSSVFVDADRLDEIWNGPEDRESITAALEPLVAGTGDIIEPHLEKISRNLALIVGNLALAKVEDEISEQWPHCLEGKERAFRVVSAFHRVIRRATESFDADVALIDVGPNLGAINRSAVIAADYIAVPLVPDLFSLQGLRNLGPTLRSWRKGWRSRLGAASEHDINVTSLPSGSMTPAGYVVMQHAIRSKRPTKSYGLWMSRIPAEYGSAVVGDEDADALTPETDPNCLSILKHYRSLMPMAMEARKPIFELTPSDGAIGSHLAAVADCRRDFEKLAHALANSCGLELPESV